MSDEPRFRGYDHDADKEAAHQILREVGWLTDEPATQQGNDVWLELSHARVAEHSVRVARALPRELARWGLLHDATEAYVGDLPRPIKQQLPTYRAAEEELMRLVAARFDLPWPMPPEVVEADTVLLATEARDLMAPPPADWELGVEPLPERIEPWPAERAKREYLACWEALGGTVRCTDPE